MLGNLIGTDINGATGLGNVGDGVFIANKATGNTVGGADLDAGNVISGNGLNGVDLFGSATTGNVVLEGILSGAGTSTLTVHGVTATIDTTGLSTQQLDLKGELTITNSAPVTFTGLPGVLTLADDAGDGESVQFTLNTNGTVTYDPSLEGILTGSGMATLAVHGVAFHIDATAVHADLFSVSGQGNYSTSQVRTLMVLPGTFTFQVFGQTVSYDFTVSALGLVDYDPSLNGKFGGRGTTTLVVSNG